MLRTNSATPKSILDVVRHGFLALRWTSSSQVSASSVIPNSTGLVIALARACGPEIPIRLSFSPFLSK